MLSLFLAILAEAQAAVREQEAKQKMDPSFNEYGIVATAWQGVTWTWGKAATLAGRPPPDAADAAGAKKDGDDDDDDDPDLDEAVSTLRTEVAAIGATVKELSSMVGDLRTNPPASSNQLYADDAGDALGLDEAKAMRRVVEALDAKLTRKLQSIDERLGKGKGAGTKNGTRSRPPPVAGAARAATVPAGAILGADGVANGNGAGKAPHQRPVGGGGVRSHTPPPLPGEQQRPDAYDEMMA